MKEINISYAIKHDDKIITNGIRTFTEESVLSKEMEFGGVGTIDRDSDVGLYIQNALGVKAPFPDDVGTEKSIKVWNDNVEQLTKLDGMTGNLYTVGRACNVCVSPANIIVEPDNKYFVITNNEFYKVFMEYGFVDIKFDTVEHKGLKCDIIHIYEREGGINSSGVLHWVFDGSLNMDDINKSLFFNKMMDYRKKKLEARSK